jgi:hypothetical protein
MTKKRKFPFKPFDFVAIGFAVALTAGSGVMVYGRGKKDAKPQVLIQGPTQSWVFPIDAEETVNVRGPLGDTVVRVHGGEAWVLSSPCDNQVCVAGGHINADGQWVACLPNEVFLMVEGSGNSQDFDAGTW